MGGRDGPYLLSIAPLKLNRMPEIPQNFTNDRPHEKLESCSRKISKTPSRAESHCIGQNTENELSTRDSRTTSPRDDSHIVRRNNEGDFSTAADATAPREDGADVPAIDGPASTIINRAFPNRPANTRPTNHGAQRRNGQR
jgi:hypothetical protein